MKRKAQDGWMFQVNQMVEGCVWTELSGDTYCSENLKQMQATDIQGVRAVQ